VPCRFSLWTVAVDWESSQGVTENGVNTHQHGNMEISIQEMMMMMMMKMKMKNHWIWG
jgi:hypothetical protein